MAQSKEKAALAEAGVATPEENAKLEHSESGKTTRDATDVGVPMKPGDPSEPQGPEDALGTGKKRGDYRNRIVGDPTEVVQTDDGPVAVAQKPRTEEIGDEKGLKGGVETS